MGKTSNKSKTSMNTAHYIIMKKILINKRIIRFLIKSRISQPLKLNLI